MGIKNSIIGKYDKENTEKIKHEFQDFIEIDEYDKFENYDNIFIVVPIKYALNKDYISNKSSNNIIILITHIEYINNNSSFIENYKSIVNLCKENSIKYFPISFKFKIGVNYIRELLDNNFTKSITIDDYLFSKCNEIINNEFIYLFDIDFYLFAIINLIFNKNLNGIFLIDKLFKYSEGSKNISKVICIMSIVPSLQKLSVLIDYDLLCQYNTIINNINIKTINTERIYSENKSINESISYIVNNSNDNKINMQFQELLNELSVNSPKDKLDDQTKQHSSNLINYDSKDTSFEETNLNDLLDKKNKDDINIDLFIINDYS